MAPCLAWRKLNIRMYLYLGYSELPNTRFDFQHPFSSTGSDSLGPLYVQAIYSDNEKLFKALVIFYTCTATRAVIQDIVNSTNTENFLQNIRRFISIRGSPSLTVHLLWFTKLSST